MRTIVFLIITLLSLASHSQGQKLTYQENVLINGKLHWSYSRQAGVNKTLGKPDSIIHNLAVCGTQFDVDDSLAYYGNIIYEKKQDTLGFSRMNFSEGSSDYVQFGKVKLTHATTLDEVFKYYQRPPDRDTNEIEDYVSGKKVRIVDIDVSSQSNEYQKWYLIFYQGKLIRFEMWIAC
jgi:hypothetical protein